VCALSTLNYSEQAPRIATSIPGLYTVNSAQIVNGTLNVNETIKLAEEAVQKILGSPSSFQNSKPYREVAEDVQADCQLVAGS
jgi:hypothetical protein